MLATKTNTKEKSVTSSKPEDKKGVVKEAAPQIHLNPLWHGLVTHVDTQVDNNAVAGAGDPSAIQGNPSHPANEPHIQRMCAECDEELSAGAETPIQAKLTVGAADDPYEKEADAVADKVMRMPVGGEQEEVLSIQSKPLSVSPIQRKPENALAQGQASAPDSVADTIKSPGSGSPLSESIRSRIEPVLGADLSSVRVHTDSQSQLASQSIQAKAFTHGNNIFVGPGQSATDTRLMAHEATHTVQQASDVIHLDRIDDIIENHEDFGGLNLQEEALGAHLAGLIRDGDLATASTVLTRLTAEDRGQVATATVGSLSASERAALGDNADAGAFHNAVSDSIISGHSGVLDLDETALGVSIAEHVRAGRYNLARQTINHLIPDNRDEVAEAIYDELTLAELRVLANSIEGADLAHTMLDGLSGGWETGEEQNAISVLSETVLNEREAIIPIVSLIALVRQLERQYPDDGPEETVTRLRQEAYPGGDIITLGFDNLIPDAPMSERYETGDGFGGTETRTRRRNLDHMPDRANRQYSHGLLTSHATENDPDGGDNPSPYIELPNGEKVDLGHFLLGLDALIHPRAESPYTEYGMSNIDPASWVADIGIAVVWYEHHVDEGEVHDKAPPNAPSTPNFDQYYLMSAPEADLISDVDPFGAFQSWQDNPGARLSQILDDYYIGAVGTGDTSGVSRRWRIFCDANGFSYSKAGGSITWDPALRAQLITRVDIFNDLYAGGGFQAGLSVVFGTTASRRTWPSTPRTVDKFLSWVQTGLEAELARAH